MGSEVTGVRPRKVVVNRCFGGFGLSEAAMRRYFEIKGWPLYIEYDKRFPNFGLNTYWRVPPEERPVPIDWISASDKARGEWNEAYGRSSVYAGDIPRDDPALVQVVEELGDKANDRCAKLSITEIPADVEWVIEEYDGSEHIAEKHRTW